MLFYNGIKEIHNNLKNGAVALMLFTEYNEEAHINHVKESSYKNGYGNGFGNGFGNGIDTMCKLYQKLKSFSRLDDYDKAMRNPEYRDQLIEEFFPDKAK